MQSKKLPFFAEYNQWNIIFDAEAQETFADGVQNYLTMSFYTNLHLIKLKQEMMIYGQLLTWKITNF